MKEALNSGRDGGAVHAMVRPRTLAELYIYIYILYIIISDLTTQYMLIWDFQEFVFMKVWNIHVSEAGARKVKLYNFYKRLIKIFNYINIIKTKIINLIRFRITFNKTN